MRRRGEEIKKKRADDTHNLKVFIGPANLQVYLEAHLFPLTVPVRITHDFDAFMAKEMLAMNAWLSHGWCTIIEKTNNINPFRSNSHFEDEINFSMDLVVSITAIGITLAKL